MAMGGAAFGAPRDPFDRRLTGGTAWAVSGRNRWQADALLLEKPDHLEGRMSTKKPYHKENLRGDLLEAARVYVKAYGHINLSIRTLAQQVGVSPGAPYHHFPDRRALLLALAVDGFQQLWAELEKGDNTGLSPEEQIKADAMRFVRFALDNPKLLELMYESELTHPEIDPDLHEYHEKSHAAGTAKLREFMPEISYKEAGFRNVALWTSVYGLVSMVNKNIIRPFGNGTFDVQEMADWVVSRAAQAALAP